MRCLKRCSIFHKIGRIPLEKGSQVIEIVSEKTLENLKIH